MSDRLLAEAWRDLAGWHVGMVDIAGRVVWGVDPYDGSVYLVNQRTGLFPAGAVKAGDMWHMQYEGSSTVYERANA